MSQQFFQLAQRQHDSILVREGYDGGGGGVLSGRVPYGSGPSGAACASAHPPPPSPPFCGGHERRVTALAQLARVLWALGYADQAQQRSQEALTQAQQTGHIASLVYAELYAAILAQYRRDVAAVQAHTDAVLALATAQGLGHRIEQGRILRGWALAMQGDAAAGVAHIQQGLVAVQSLGLKLYQAYFLSLLVEAYGQTGQPEHGLQVLAEATTLIATTEVRWWEPEVARLQGELLAQLRIPMGPDRRLFPPRSHRGPRATGHGLGAAGDHESEPAVAAAGQARGSP